MRALITGAGGFVGSHLTERLLAEGSDVMAVEGLTEYYDVLQKRSNLDELSSLGCRVHLADLRTADLATMLDGVDVVFHQAGQPGVRASWSSGFGDYIEHNIAVTQRLLEASRDAGVQRFVFASSSSVYGNALRYPTTEDDLPRPQSPYGVTKLAAEHLCGVYARTWGLPTVSLRYFTVFGPRQRPDMAMHRLIEAAISGDAFPMYGDGRQIRDFTYVDDVVEANLLAATSAVDPGEVVNVAGGGSTDLLEIVEIVGWLVGRPVRLDRRPAARGDVVRTGGAIDRARRVLGWSPSIGIHEGLARQVAWHMGRAPVKAARAG